MYAPQMQVLDINGGFLQVCEKCLHLPLNGRRERTAFLSGQQRGQTGDVVFVLADVFFILSLIHI